MLSVLERARIHVLIHEGQSVSYVSRLTKHTRNTVKKYSKKLTTTSYKRKVTPLIARRRAALVRLAGVTRSNGSRVWPAHGSAAALRRALIAEGFPAVSRRQVSREIRVCGMKSYVRPRTPTRRHKDVAARREFARREIRKNHRRLVFTDESWLSCNEATGRRQIAKSRKDVLAIERKSRWNLPCIMIWAAVGYNYKGPLVILPSKKTDDEQRCFRLDGKGYRRRCVSKIAHDLVRLNLTLVQDGARSHAAASTTAYLKRKHVAFVDDFPPYSPDLNMIEPIWHILAQKIGMHCPLTTDELIEAAKVEWAALPQCLINSYIDHFPKALRKCI